MGIEDLYLAVGGEVLGGKEGTSPQLSSQKSSGNPLQSSLLPQSLAGQSPPLEKDLASPPVEIRKRTGFWVCSLFIMLNGLRPPARTGNSFPWGSRAGIQPGAYGCSEEQG